jgi:aspartate aminotransferase-like enzyme
VHQESSTGVLNDLLGLVKEARQRAIRVCVDCVSSLGATPLNLTGVYLASGASGKSLGSYAGLAIVFADSVALESVDVSRIPSYFDIRAALASEGPRYTFPSSIVRALDVALEEYGSPQKARSRYAAYQALGASIREELRQLELPPIASEECAAPVVTTFAPPGTESSESFVGRCKAWGYSIGGHSQYLAERRLVQIATMGAISREDCTGLFDRLRRWLKQRERGNGREARLEPVSAWA